mgnify:CR=1 FL=1
MQTEIYEFVENLISKMNKAAQQGDFSKADEIKRDFLKLNIKIDHVRHGTQWKII